MPQVEFATPKKEPANFSISLPKISVPKYSGFSIPKEILIYFLIIPVLVLAAFAARRIHVKIPKRKNLSKAIDSAIGALAEDAFEGKIISIKKTEPISEAIRKLLDNGVEGILVVSDSKILGWVNERSIAGGIILDKAKLSDPVGNLKIVPPVYAKPELSAAEINKLMHSSESGKVLISDKGKVKGVVSSSDIAKVLNEFYEQNAIGSWQIPDVLSLSKKSFLRISRDATVVQAQKIMSANSTDFLIVDGKNPAILTERDIVDEIKIYKERAKDAKVSFLAKSPIISIKQYLSIFEANKIMLDSFRRLPIMGDGGVRAFITQEDVVSAIISFLRSLKEPGKRDKPNK